jgi:hypothetical protein
VIAPLGTTIPGFDFLFGFWQRKGEYTADRLGLIAGQNIEAATRALIKISSGPRALEHIQIKDVLDQIAKLNSGDITYDLGETLGTHPYMANRIRELIMFDRLEGRANGTKIQSCVHCGGPVKIDDLYCTHCGMPLRSERTDFPDDRADAVRSDG